MPFIARWREDEYPATDEVQCVSIYIPAGDEFKAVLAALLSIPTDVNSYQDPTSPAADGLAAVWDEAYSFNNWDGCGVPPECDSMDSAFYLDPSSMLVASGNPIVFVSDASQHGNGYMAQNPPINGNYLYTDREFEAGTWQYSVLCRTTTASGKLRIQLTPPVGSVINLDHDLYSNPVVQNVRFNGNFNLPARGKWYIYLIANGKHASSSGYLLSVSSIHFWRTS